MDRVTLPKIRFQGQEYVFVGRGELEDGGALAVPEQFAQGKASHAFLGSDGIVRRFHQEIGVIADIEVIGEAVLEVDTNEAFWNMLTDPSWD